MFLIPPFGINPLLKLIESFCVSPTVISFGCTKVKICVFFPEFGAGVGVGVTTGAGVGLGVTTGAGVFFTKEVKVGPFKSNNPGNQYLQRSFVSAGTSIAIHG